MNGRKACRNGARTLSHALYLSTESPAHYVSITWLIYMGNREPEIARLDVESNELTKAWALLREKLPSDLQFKFAQRPQGIEDVFSLVRQIENEWQAEKRKGVSGRTKTSFRKMCSVLGSHSNLLGILPSSSHYASVFCGTLQTLIQVRLLVLDVVTTDNKSCIGLDEL